MIVCPCIGSRWIAKQIAPSKRRETDAKAGPIGLRDSRHPLYPKFSAEDASRESGCSRASARSDPPHDRSSRQSSPRRKGGVVSGQQGPILEWGRSKEVIGDGCVGSARCPSTCTSWCTARQNRHSTIGGTSCGSCAKF